MPLGLKDADVSVLDCFAPSFPGCGLSCYRIDPGGVPFLVSGCSESRISDILVGVRSPSASSSSLVCLFTAVLEMGISFASLDLAILVLLLASPFGPMESLDTMSFYSSTFGLLSANVELCAFFPLPSVPETSVISFAMSAFFLSAIANL